MLLFSCYKEYDLKERLSLATHITNESGEDLANTNIDIYVDFYFSDFYLSELHSQNINKFQPAEFPHDLISFGKTDSNGKVILHFPAPIENNDFSVVFSKENDDLKPLNVFLKKTDFENNFLQLPPQKLYAYSNLVQLQINTDLAENFNLVEYSFNGIIAYNWLTIEDFSNPKTFQFVQVFDVQKNQTLQLNYTIKSNVDGIEETINEEVLLNVGSEDLEYTIQNP